MGRPAWTAAPRAAPAPPLAVTLVLALALALALAGLAGCGNSSGAAPTTTTAPMATTSTLQSAAQPCGLDGTAPATYQHVVWIVMENKSYGDVIGNRSAPYLTSLAQHCATATDYSSVGSPSLPNYIAMTSGSSQGISDDNSPGSHKLTVDNLFRQVRAAGGSAVSYEEHMPSNCATSNSGQYAVRHNPAAYYIGGDDRVACQRDDVALGTTTDGALASAASGDTLPRFAFITPDICDDAHDCGVGTADRWLRQWLPVLLDSKAYASGSMAVFVVWDEYTPMPFVALHPAIMPGTVVRMPVNHFALLRTTEDLLGMSPFLGQAATAPSMRGDLHL